MDIEWLRTQLQRPGKTQRGLAKHVGIDETAVSRILKGQRKIQLHEADLIRSYFDSDGPALSAHKSLRTRVERTPIYGLEVTRAAAPGVWREQGAVIMLDRTFVPSSPDPRFMGMHQFAVLLGGPRRYAICIDYDANAQPHEGELVVVERHRESLVETTLRRLTRGADGWYGVLVSTPEPSKDVIHSIADLRIIGKVIGIYEPTV